MWNKKNSVIKSILQYLLILTGLLVAILIVFLYSSYSILKKEIDDSSDAFLRIYSNEINNVVSNMDNVLTNIFSQQEDLFKLKSRDENERLLASQSLYNYMQNLISANSTADLIVVYDSDYDICLDAKNEELSYAEKSDLRRITCETSYNNSIMHKSEWNFLNVDGETFMYKVFRSTNRVIAIYTRTNRLLQTLSIKNTSNRHIVLTDSTGKIGQLWGSKTEKIKIGENIRSITDSNYYKIGNDVAGGQMTVYCCTSKSSVFQQIHASMFVVIFTVCLAVSFMLFILHYTKKEIAVPMRRMVDEMEKIKGGKYDNRIDENFKTKEFMMLQETINQMIDEIMNFKIQTYEKRIELQNMELKSIRLQLKPHFFLNALTTISSLSLQGKNDKIRKFIDALSKNIRYMFNAGFHTVSVKEEIRHAENYLEMQELKYPNCVFLLVDLPHELEDWKIPQMLIHTFLENEYKYAVSPNRTLTVLIRISRQDYNGEETLLIEIEDDGKGYPEEVLSYMSGVSGKMGEKGARIGLWSIKRMMELMYERNDLIKLENINPHGCMNKIYVPKNAKHELD